jgi:hypothetical protein
MGLNQVSPILVFAFWLFQQYYMERCADLMRNPRVWPNTLSFTELQGTCLFTCSGGMLVMDNSFDIRKKQISVVLIIHTFFWTC